jgi:hypothetical protein
MCLVIVTSTSGSSISLYFPASAFLVRLVMAERHGIDVISLMHPARDLQNQYAWGSWNITTRVRSRILKSSASDQWRK